MEVIEAMMQRRSIRKYTDEKVTDEQINTLMHCAMSGPSAVNKCPWEFYVIRNEEVLQQLRKATRYTNIVSPCAIVVCGNMSRALPMQLKDFWIQDCSAATENILLSATALNLGTVWCGIYPEKNAVKKVSSILNLPDKHIPLNIIFVGHPDQSPEPRDQYEQKRVHMID